MVIKKYFLLILLCLIAINGFAVNSTLCVPDTIIHSKIKDTTKKRESEIDKIFRQMHIGSSVKQEKEYTENSYQYEINKINTNLIAGSVLFLLIFPLSIPFFYISFNNATALEKNLLKKKSTESNDIKKQNKVKILKDISTVGLIVSSIFTGLYLIIISIFLIGLN